MTSTREQLATQRLISARILANADRAIERTVRDAMSTWLTVTRVAILREVRNLAPGMTAAGYHTASPALDAAAEGFNAWQQKLTDSVLPSVGYAFGEAYGQVRKSAEFSPARFQTEYMETVGDRLRIWPVGAFEELRPELAEAISESESYDDITARVGMVLGIDAPTRELRARISEVDRRIADTRDPAELVALREKRRDLWTDHDASLGEWEWKARRIARTEAHGAVIGGKLKAAQVRAEYTREALYKRWQSTDDERVRPSHRVADGQLVRIAESFRVGGFLIEYPAAPISIAPHETINCRCDVQILDYDQVQDMLSGPDGSAGAIEAGGIRIGPDDPDLADEAIERWATEHARPVPVSRRGEDHGQQVAPVPDDAPPLAHEVDHHPEHPYADLTQFTDDQLIQWMDDAGKDGDVEQFDAVAAELDRRIADGVDDPMMDDTPATEDDPAELLPEDEPLDEVLDVEVPDDVEVLPSDGDHVDDLPGDDGANNIRAPFAQLFADDEDDPWALDAAEPDPDDPPATHFDRAEAALAEAMATGADDDTIGRLLDDLAQAEARDAADAAKAAETDRQTDRILELVEQGWDGDEAESEVTGRSVERIRRDRAITELRLTFPEGRGFDELVALEWRRRVYQLYMQAEDDTRGHMIQPRHQNRVDPMDLWTGTEAFARKYASSEMLEWFDQHGRLTKQNVIDEYLSGGRAADTYQGQDFLR